MSCTVSELPTGCRLRGMATTSQSTTNSGSGGGVSVGGVGVGGAGSGAINTSGLHVGGMLTKTNSLGAGGGGGSGGSGGGASNVLQESNAPIPRQPSQKPCCFCWCCCCSCSWAKCLAIKNADENAPTKRDIAGSEFHDNEQPTLEEIRSWGKSFDKLMKSASGRKVFGDFLRSEFSEENILFWLACEDLKNESSAEVVEEKARLIYEDYISILSPREVSLDSRVREIVNRNMIEPTTNTFDEAQIQIYTLMHRDSYPRFLNSQKFKTLAELQDSSSATGSKASSPT